MKKTLLLCLTATLCGNAALAEIKTPEVYPGASFQRVSADGHYAYSEVNGTITIYDLVEGTTLEFAEDGMNGKVYLLGLGNCVTPDGGILLGSTDQTTNAAYYKDGEWHNLPVINPDYMNLSNGITADGSRICGSIGTVADITLDEQTMLLPAYWERNADGTYGDPVILPHPDKDFFGEVPQYITAICITNDGKTIAGQIMFSSGRMTAPVLYQQDNEGNWTYSLPTKALFNPDKIEAVENPGYFEEMQPSYEDYMTPDELQAYLDAIQAYYDAQDWSAPYPEFTDYMTAEEYAQYQEAFDGWQTRYDAFMELFDAYTEYVEQVLATSPNYMFNNLLFSTDGKTLIGTLEAEDPNSMGWFPTYIYTPCTLDIATGDFKKIETDLSLLVSGVADGGVILAYNGQSSTPMLGYVLKGDDIQPLDEYLSAINPEYGTWIKENLTHEIVVDFDPDTWDEIYAEMTYTGMPVANPDMSIITIWNNCPWWNYEYLAEGTVFFVSENTGLTSVAVEGKTMALKNGTIAVPEGYTSLEIYNLSGACLQSVKSPCGNYTLKAGKGVYIAKGTRADGTETIIKLCK